MPTRRFQAALRVVLGLSGASCLLVGTTASAHIDLLYPSARARGRANANLDEQPCGQRDNARVLERVSVFRPGASLTVVWDAYVQHPTYFRIAFDVDGDDSFPPLDPSPPALDEPAGADSEIILGYVEDELGELAQVEHTVTLPRQPCESCTLQLTQLIYDVPFDEAVYYQCADITLEGEPVPPPPRTLTSSPGTDGSGSGCTLGSAPAPSRGLWGVLGALIGLLTRRHTRRTPLPCRRACEQRPLRVLRIARGTRPGAR